MAENQSDQGFLSLTESFTRLARLMIRGYLYYNTYSLFWPELTGCTPYLLGMPEAETAQSSLFRDTPWLPFENKKEVGAMQNGSILSPQAGEEPSPPLEDWKVSFLRRMLRFEWPRKIPECLSGIGSGV